MEKVETNKVVLPGLSPHSQAVIAGGFVFTQGMIYLTPEAKLLEGTLKEKVTLIMENLKTILDEARTTFSNVVIGRSTKTDLT